MCATVFQHSSLTQKRFVELGAFHGPRTRNHSVQFHLTQDVLVHNQGGTTPRYSRAGWVWWHLTLFGWLGQHGGAGDNENTSCGVDVLFAGQINFGNFRLSKCTSTVILILRCTSETTNCGLLGEAHYFAPPQNSNEHTFFFFPEEQCQMCRILFQSSVSSPHISSNTNNKNARTRCHSIGTASQDELREGRTLHIFHYLYLLCAFSGDNFDAGRAAERGAE